MPEGHTIHCLARDQQELVGHRLSVTSPQGRFAADAVRLEGRVLAGVEAAGKHLLLHFGDAGHLHVHLGMQGKFLRDTTGRAPLRQARVRLEAQEQRVAWELVAPSACQLLDDDQVGALLSRLGPDPLRPDADGAEARRRLSSEERGIGEVLLDQEVVAGAGNVLRAEVLAACGVHPRRPGRSLSEAEVACIWDTLSAMMARAVEEGRILPVPTAPGVDRTSLLESDLRFVYKQDRCRRCGTLVATETVGGRVSYACPRCQPLD